jgi:hypothetical protein
MSTGKEEIKGLTNSWYGLAVFNAIATVLMNTRGLFSLAFSIVIAGFVFLFSVIVTYILSKLLLAKSSLTRVILVVFSLVFAILGVLGTGSSFLTFFKEWSLSYLIMAGMSAIATMMYFRSFRVLTSKSVKSYFA